jgi:hypothetical protein
LVNFQPERLEDLIPVQSPMSSSFDFGDFKNQPKGRFFNERQAQLMVKVFESVETFTVVDMEKACFRSGNFARLWWGICEFCLGKKSEAASHIRTLVRQRRKRSVPLKVVYKDV